VARRRQVCTGQLEDLDAEAGLCWPLLGQAGPSWALLGLAGAKLLTPLFDFSPLSDMDPLMLAYV
jgi:hypothetical protein